jgi:hypothetical protein
MTSEGVKSGHLTSTGVMPALEQTDDKADWLLNALLDVGLWPWLAAALLLYIKAGLGHDDGGKSV